MTENKIVLPGEIERGTLIGILKQAKINRDEFLKEYKKQKVTSNYLQILSLKFSKNYEKLVLQEGLWPTPNKFLIKN